jgi:hypothetical protein
MHVCAGMLQSRVRQIGYRDFPNLKKTRLIVAYQEGLLNVKIVNTQ